MKNNLIISFISLNFLFLLFVCFYVFKNENKKVVYVDSMKLFHEFKMTKELINVGEKEMGLKKAKLDSLYVITNTSNETKNKEQAVKEIIQLRQEIEAFQNNYNYKNSDKIWERINSYLKDLSKEKEYDLIIGSQSNRDVFCSEESLNITNEALKYINKRYEGFN